jgi:anti-sigma regulatory factor (Ser/Thr protein kinase)
MANEKEICFLDSFRADTSIVPEVIDRLYNDLKKMEYPKDEIDEIILSMDEAITNAVQETICTINEQYCHSKMNREITVRYNIDDDEFNATVIDHGKGLDIDKMLKKIPDTTSDQYHQEIFDYIKTQEKNRLKVRLNGKELFLNGIGAGLRIILSFMDIVTIDLLDTQTVVSETVSEFTDGTILNMKRKRRY